MNMTEVTEKRENIFTQLKKYITKNRNTIVPILLMGFFVVAQNEMVFASSSGIDFARTTLKGILETLIKIMFIGSGVLVLVFGVYELAVTVFGQNPDAKNKAVLGFSVGIVLIALGAMFLTQVDAMISFFFS